MSRKNTSPLSIEVHSMTYDYMLDEFHPNKNTAYIESWIIEAIEQFYKHYYLEQHNPFEEDAAKEYLAGFVSWGACFTMPHPKISIQIVVPPNTLILIEKMVDEISSLLPDDIQTYDWFKSLVLSQAIMDKILRKNYPKKLATPSDKLLSNLAKIARENIEYYESYKDLIKISSDNKVMEILAKHYGIQLDWSNAQFDTELHWLFVQEVINASPKLKGNFRAFTCLSELPVCQRENFANLPWK
ncbi:hypothetical protein C1E23_07765 [Pseudoalteromonas phenolica]|uniref:Uncharacterized protein n=1 Tax=Pseudoalteromonas phenolica TaxID=161398 RepID=A0A4Q7INE5_9GAMM|nr:hypothetical protein [Pseudoalteromonas phenolica]RZQ53754.1 hypothetical protein C1E23_07765 [Pseudoalteromonas phenolica]